MQAKVVTFLGVKGGVGQTLTMCSLAVALAQKHKKKVIIADLCSGRKDIKYFMNMAAIRTADKLVELLQTEQEIPAIGEC